MIDFWPLFWAVGTSMLVSVAIVWDGWFATVSICKYWLNRSDE